MSHEFQEILQRLISSPLRSQVNIDFDSGKKIFILSVPIYSSFSDLPPSIKDYVESRKNLVFAPHKTSFRFEGSKKVLLIQEIPFSWGIQPSFRDQVNDFWNMAKKLHQMLTEIAIEEKFKEALHLNREDA